jgi:hypothetical protein
MKDKWTSMTEKAAEQLNDMTLNFMEKSVSNYFTGVEEALKTLGMGHFFVNRMFDGGIVPAINSFIEMEKDLTDSLLQTFYGEKDWPSYLQDIYNRVYAGTRYDKLVLTLGKELFGSAVFEGEKVLSENDFFTLTYIPAKKGVAQQKAALFHVGGVLPYSDRIVRFLPDTNFYDRFIERGIPVYTMELKGDKDEIKNYGSLNMEKMIQSIKDMSDIAFEHNNKQRMIIEGYCGLGMQAMAYVMGQAKDAGKKFKVATTFVAPINGVEADILAEMMLKMPQHLLLTQFTLSNLMGGYVSGDSLRRTQDMALKGFFPKTGFGRFVTGWKNKEYANVEKVEDLSDNQVKDLAGAYWISPQNCNRYPVPLDMARYSTRLFRMGVAENGDVPYVYKGKKLSFQNPLKETDIQFVGFYGGKDKLVPEKSGRVLEKALGKRYTHVVHERAGHVSYILTPKVWDKSNPKALNPNPVDVLLEAYNK